MRAHQKVEIEGGWSLLLKRGETAWPCRWLGSATWSVLDFVRTDLRTVRLAIAKGDRSDRVMHPSQVAGHDDPPYERHGNEDDGARLGRGRVAGNRLQQSVGRWVEKDRAEWQVRRSAQ